MLDATEGELKWGLEGAGLSQKIWWGCGGSVRDMIERTGLLGKEGSGYL